MCQVSTIRNVAVPKVVLNKPTLVNVKKEEPRNTNEYGAYGDYWGCDELAYPQPSLGTSTSSSSLKSESSYASYGSYWGLDEEDEE